MENPLPVLGKLSLAKLWESAYNETVYAAFFWSCLETMVKTGGVCVVENQALVDVWGLPLHTDGWDSPSSDFWQTPGGRTQCK
ncbi:MAG: hypothetical protein SPG79_09355, partial [Candidatus Faecousia sp.]|nr:hypothetical protein [Candidatus Faecousia sp.]